MRGVDADIDQIVSIEDVQLDLLGEGVGLAVLLDDGGDGDRGHARLVGRPFKADRQRAAGADGVALGIGADDKIADLIGQGLDGGFLGLAVEQRGRQSELFVCDGRGGAALELGNAELQRLTDPDRSGHGQIAVTLGHADEVVGVLGIQLAGHLALVEVCLVVPCVSHDAGVGDQLNLGDGVGLIRIIDADVEGQLFRDLGNDGAHHFAVDGVVDLEVLILGGIDAAGADGFINAFLGEIVRDDDVARVVGVAPAALMVILVVGRCNVPALIEREDVLLVARIVAALADLAFAVADLNEEHAGVDNGIPISKVGEVAEGLARMVELAHGVRALLLAEQGVISLHAGVFGLVVQLGVVAGNDARGVEGVDMAGAAGPRHFKAADCDDAAVVLVELRDGVLIGFPAMAGVGILDQRGVIERLLVIGSILGVEVVGVIGEGDELDVRAFGDALDVVQSVRQAARAVGILGVAVELAEVALILRGADGEAPGLGGGLAVLAGDGHGHGGAAVGHARGGLVGDLAVCVGRLDLRAVDGHRNGRLLAGVGDLCGDFRTLFIAGLGVDGGRDGSKHRLVLDGDLHGVVKLLALVVRTGNRDDQLRAGDLCRREGDAVNAVLQRGRVFLAVEGDDRRALHAEGCIDGKGQRVVHADIGIKHRAEIDLRGVDDALDYLHTLRNGIEIEGVDGVVRDLVHAVNLEGIRIVLQPL